VVFDLRSGAPVAGFAPRARISLPFPFRRLMKRKQAVQHDLVGDKASEDSSCGRARQRQGVTAVAAVGTAGFGRIGEDVIAFAAL
jgi:hypothetical protein